MAGKINLFYETYTEPKLSKLISDYKVIRIKGLVRILRHSKLSDPYRAIIDTGAHMSVVPFYIWKDAKIERLGHYEVSGLSTKPECKIPGVIGKIWLLIQDRCGNKTDLQAVHACLVLTDEVPFIIGFKDLLSRFNVCFNYEKGEAYIEVSEKSKKSGGGR